jgi:hypothetical protein
VHTVGGGECSTRERVTTSTNHAIRTSSVYRNHRRAGPWYHARPMAAAPARRALTIGLSRPGLHLALTYSKMEDHSWAALAHESVSCKSHGSIPGFGAAAVGTTAETASDDIR